MTKVDRIMELMASLDDDEMIEVTTRADAYCRNRYAEAAARLGAEDPVAAAAANYLRLRSAESGGEPC